MRLISLFTGLGGLDLGLEGGFDYLGNHYEKTGIETVFTCDIKPSAAKVFDVYQKKRGKTIRLTVESIIDLVRQHEKTGSIFPNADIVTGGFPCQDFSHCGTRKGFKSKKNHLNEIVDAPTVETRGMLYYWMLQTILAVRPKVFIAENVKGILTQKTGGYTAIDRIRMDFGSTSNPVKYRVGYKMINAREYGVPQNRERAIIVGMREDVCAELRIADPLYLMPEPQLGWETTCQEALKGLLEPTKTKDPSQRALSKAAYMKDGQGQVEIPIHGVAPTVRSEHHGNIEYRRLSWAHGGKHCEELDAGMLERRLTVRECARLQSFPDDMEFLPLVSASEAYKLIGNAVPPLVGHAIGKSIMEVFSKNKPKEIACIKNC